MAAYFLMSGHFGLQHRCHLASQLFYRKGCIMHRNTNTFTAHYKYTRSWASTCTQHTQNTCYSRKHAGICQRFYSDDAYSLHKYNTLPPELLRNIKLFILHRNIYWSYSPVGGVWYIVEAWLKTNALYCAQRQLHFWCHLLLNNQFICDFDTYLTKAQWFCFCFLLS